MRFPVGLICAALVLGPAALPAQYLRVSTTANIRTGPSTNSEVVVQARAGDVFELEGRSGEWYEINMFSGEYRYVHSSLASPTVTLPPKPQSVSTRRQAFREIVRAQDRAVQEARRQYPDDVMRQIDYERLLYDRYELPIFRRHRIAPPHNVQLRIEGIRNGWIPPLEFHPQRDLKWPRLLTSPQT